MQCCLVCQVLFLYLRSTRGLTFDEIYEGYGKKVYNLALHYVRNCENAEEITQDVFVTIHQSLHQFEGRSGLNTWIYRITINKSLDFIKAARRKKRGLFLNMLFYRDSKDAIAEPAHSDHPGALMEQKEATQRIFTCINELTDNQKTVLILSKIEQKSQQEIAEILRLSPKAVESLLQRAKTALVKKLETAKENEK